MKSYTGQFFKKILQKSTFKEVANTLEYDANPQEDGTEVLAFVEIEGNQYNCHFLFEAPIEFIDWMLSYCLMVMYGQHFTGDKNNVAKGNRQDHPTRVSLFDGGFPTDTRGLSSNPKYRST